MVARGDLGVEMPPEDVPSVQKRIVRACRLAGKPVVVATQMLESMINAPAPTRAEASDVATAVYDGADAVMLSAETAAGQYPIEAVAMMNRIIRRVQARPALSPRCSMPPHAEPEQPRRRDQRRRRARSRDTIGAAAIVTYTTSGATALRAARERPEVPILALTSNSAPRGGWPSSGARIASRRRTSQLRRNGGEGHQRIAAAKASPSPASAW